MSTNTDWEKWGKDNPFFGVFTNDKYKGSELSTTLLDEFYGSGVKDVDKMMRRVEMVYGKKIRFHHAVDFGSGVGRLSFALSDHADKVTGMDISPSMVSNAKRYSKVRKVQNVKFIVTDDALAGLPKSYDLVYSYIVLQHVPVRQGEYIVQRLAQGLDDGGCLAIHITFGLKRSYTRKALLALRQNVVPIRWVANVVRGVPINTPNMRMHAYDMNKILDILRENGIADISGEFTDHGGFIGALLVGRKL